VSPLADVAVAGPPVGTRPAHWPRTWTFEAVAPGEAHCHEVVERQYLADDGEQRIEVVRTRAFGRGLLLDGRIQHLEADEYIYSEAIVHPAALAVGKGCRRVLVVGGGPGGAVREALKHDAVEEVVQVEIDPRMAELARSHFAHIAGGFHRDPRYRLVIADIRDHLVSTPDPYDLVIHDVSEPLPGSPAEFLFTPGHFAAMARVVSPAGAFVTWAGAAGPCSGVDAAAIHALTAGHFAHAEALVCHAQSYGTSWLFSVGSHRDLDLAGRSAGLVDRLISGRLAAPLTYYDGTTHRHMVSLPKDLRARLAAGTTPAATCRKEESA
jgi:spermidine synthase